MNPLRTLIISLFVILTLSPRTAMAWWIIPPEKEAAVRELAALVEAAPGLAELKSSQIIADRVRFTFAGASGGDLLVELVRSESKQPGDIAAGEQDAPAAAETLQPDVGPESNDDPVRASARMRFAHPHHVAERQIRQHAVDYTVDRRQRGRISQRGSRLHHALHCRPSPRRLLGHSSVFSIAAWAAVAHQEQ